MDKELHAVEAVDDSESREEQGGHGGEGKSMQGTAPQAASESKKRKRCCAVDNCTEYTQNGCLNAVQSCGVCIANSGDVSCETGNHPHGCTNGERIGGMGTKHSSGQDSQEERQSTSVASAMDNDSSRLIDLTEEPADIAAEPTEAEDVPSDTAAVDCSSAEQCSVDGCPEVVEKRGQCRFHSVNERCNYPGCCRNKAHSDSLYCLTHRNALDDRRQAHPPDSSAAPTAPVSNEQSTQPHQQHKIWITAREQELQARQYCDEVLSARSTELVAILGDSTTAEYSDAACGTVIDRPMMQTTARYQQKIAEQFCNEVLAARAIDFIRTNPRTRPSAPAVVKLRKKGSRRVRECNIRGCRNLASGRPLCAAHEAWATGQYPAAHAT